MYIKMNQNRNRINIPVPMGANQKVGVFFSKQQRTKQLQQQNLTLQQTLHTLLTQFHHQTTHLTHLQTSTSTTSTLLSAISTENSLLQQQNHKIQHTLDSLLIEKASFQQKEKLMTSKMIDLQKELFDNTKKYEENSNLLRRYEEEVKHEKTLRCAQGSAGSVVQKLEKELELLKRNVVVHENKLEGKRKYLALLEKKELAEIQKEEKEKLNQKMIKSPKKTLNIYEKSSSSATGVINSPRKKFDQVKSKDGVKSNKEIQDKKENAKKFNDLTRKKNALMLQNNSKKAF